MHFTSTVHVAHSLRVVVRDAWLLFAFGLARGVAATLTAALR